MNATAIVFNRHEISLAENHAFHAALLLDRWSCLFNLPGPFIGYLEFTRVHLNRQARIMASKDMLDVDDPAISRTCFRRHVTATARNVLCLIREEETRRAASFNSSERKSS